MTGPVVRRPAYKPDPPPLLAEREGPAGGQIRITWEDGQLHYKLHSEGVLGPTTLRLFKYTVTGWHHSSKPGRSSGWGPDAPDVLVDLAPALAATYASGMAGIAEEELDKSSHLGFWVELIREAPDLFLIHRIMER